jgi:hypothetical protein
MFVSRVRVSTELLSIDLLKLYLNEVMGQLIGIALLR